MIETGGDEFMINLVAKINEVDKIYEMREWNFVY